jgi:hypothetical protein
MQGNSVADPGCISRIPDPDFYPSRIPVLGCQIPDPARATKEEREKKFASYLFFIATNFAKKIIILFLNRYRKYFYPKNCLSALKNKSWGSEIGDPWSGKNLFRVPDPGFKKATDPGSRICNTGGKKRELQKITRRRDRKVFQRRTENENKYKINIPGYVWRKDGASLPGKGL